MARINISVDKDRGREFLELRLANEPFIDAVTKLRQKWGIDPQYLANHKDDDAFSEWESLLENNDLQNDVSVMLKALDISQSYLDYTHQFVIDNYDTNIEVGDTWFNSEGTYMLYDEENPDRIEITIGREGTYSDLKKAWEYIKDLRGSVKKKKKRPNIRRNFRIHIMARRGSTVAEIWNEIHREYDEDLDYEHIRKIVSESYDRFKVPKRKKNYSQRKIITFSELEV